MTRLSYLAGDHPLRTRLLRTSVVAFLAATLLAFTPGSSAGPAVPQSRGVSPAQWLEKPEDPDPIRRP